MLTSDPDYYYSPQSVAQVVAEVLGRARPSSVLDSNCGGGALLDAVERDFPHVLCAGIDVDATAIRRLRRSRPHWTLVQGDALSLSPWKTLKQTSAKQIDVAVLNPPFSMGFNKGMQLSLKESAGIDLRCSLAMAHVLTALVQAAPRRVVAVLPDSWVHSELDEDARRLIALRYDIAVVKSFRNSTFRGARANSVLVAMNSSKTQDSAPKRNRSLNLPTGLELVRGGLPCFQAQELKRGTPFIHTTDLGQIAQGMGSKGLRRVQSNGRGLVQGHVVLLPRVGLPKLGHLSALHLPTQVQLSDCVIAIKCDSPEGAATLVSVLQEDFLSLSELYRGTGARYVTVDRLSRWLQAK